MRKLMSLLIMGALFVSPALAQIEKGNSELSVAISLEGSTDDYSGTFGGTTFEFVTKSSQQTVVFSYGYFITSVSEVGGSLFLSRFTSQTEDDDTDLAEPGNGQISVFYSYHFPMENPKTAPYVGVEAGKGFSIGWDEDDQGATAPKRSGFGIYAGLKYFVSTKTSFGPVLRMRFQSYEQTFGTSPNEFTFRGTTKSTALLFQVATLF